jgi:hypothetical protein
MHDVISETTSSEAKQFDFLEGEWNAICRFPLLDGSWGEGPGSLTARNSWMAAFPWNSSRDPIKELRSRPRSPRGSPGLGWLSGLPTGESHRSMDGGKTWTKHWVIDFTRKATS